MQKEVFVSFIEKTTKFNMKNFNLNLFSKSNKIIGTFLPEGEAT